MHICHAKLKKQLTQKIFVVKNDKKYVKKKKNYKLQLINLIFLIKNYMSREKKSIIT